jgi:hypothetical protein
LVDAGSQEKLCEGGQRCFAEHAAPVPILESQLALVGGQLLGPFAIKRVPQTGDPLPGSGLASNHEREVILAFSPGLHPCDLGLQNHTRLAHGGRKGIQIKGL